MVTSVIYEFYSNTTVIVWRFDDHHLLVCLHSCDALLLVIRQDVTPSQEVKMLGSMFLQHLMVAGPQVVLPADDIKAWELIDLLVWPERKVDLVPALLSDGEGLPPAGHAGTVRVEETEAGLSHILLDYGTDSVRRGQANPGQLLG